jgi:hypothetical protein
MDILRKPFTFQEIKQRMDEENKVEGVVSVDISSIIDSDFIQFLDLLSLKLVGGISLKSIEYKLVGNEGNRHVLISVSGDATDIVT